MSNTPLSKLAPSLAISVFALTALCKKYNIPYPGSGYWTKKSLGIEQGLEPLPDPSDSSEPVISIEPAKPRRRPGIVKQSVVQNKDTNATTVVDANASTRPENYILWVQDGWRIESADDAMLGPAGRNGE